MGGSDAVRIQDSVLRVLAGHWCGVGFSGVREAVGKVPDGCFSPGPSELGVPHNLLGVLVSSSMK